MPHDRLYKYRHVEISLAALHLVDADDAKAFHARIRNLRNFGIFPRSGGSGSRISYSFQHIWRIHILLLIEHLGITPARICQMVREKPWIWNISAGQANYATDVWILILPRGGSDWQGAISSETGPLSALTDRCKLRGHRIFALIDLYGSLGDLQRALAEAMA